MEGGLRVDAWSVFVDSSVLIVSSWFVLYSTFLQEVRCWYTVVMAGIARPKCRLWPRFNLIISIALVLDLHAWWRKNGTWPPRAFAAITYESTLGLATGTSSRIAREFTSPVVSLARERCLIMSTLLRYELCVRQERSIANILAIPGLCPSDHASISNYFWVFRGLLDKAGRWGMPRKSCCRKVSKCSSFTWAIRAMQDGSEPFYSITKWSTSVILASWKLYLCGVSSFVPNIPLTLIRYSKWLERYSGSRIWQWFRWPIRFRLPLFTLNVCVVLFICCLLIHNLQPLSVCATMRALTFWNGFFLRWYLTVVVGYFM